MNPVNVLIGSRIRSARESNQLSQRELALKASVPLDALIAIEDGSLRANTSVLVDIASALDVPIGSFFKSDVPEQSDLAPPVSPASLEAIRRDITEAIALVDNYEMLSALLVVAKSIQARSSRQN
jgi:transcriptional regulator with XRE-family HTH domain